jgi:hypothetical protein
VLGNPSILVSGMWSECPLVARGNPGSKTKDGSGAVPGTDIGELEAASGFKAFIGLSGV